MGKKGLFVLCAFILFVLAFLPNVNANVMISKPNEVYNLGDNIDVNLDISEPNSFSGRAELFLNCDNKEPYLIYSRFGVKGGDTLSYTLPLLKELVMPENLLGNCFIEAIIKDVAGDKISSAKSEQFLISDKINITAKLNKEYFLPGERIEFSGKAIKLNNDLVEGTASIKLTEEYQASVKNGDFSGNIEIKKDIKSGKHNLIVFVSDELGNNGEIEKEVNIIPIQTELNIEISSNMLLPQETLKAKATLYDQAGGRLYDKVLFSFYSPDGKKVSEKLTMADKEIEFKFPPSAMQGNWKVKAQTDALEATATVYIRKCEAVDVSINEGILYVANIGNVPYSKPLEITFTQDNKTIIRVIELSLNAGEKIAYVLEAPQGDYNIDIETGDTAEIFKGIPLTGKVIDITELSELKREELIRNLVFASALVLISLITAGVIKVINTKKEKAFKEEQDAIYSHVQKLAGKKQKKESETAKFKGFTSLSR